MTYYNNDIKLKAKAVSLETLYQGNLQRCGRTLRGLCPFHDDTSKPNFHIYPKTNSWYCFACGQGGDSISFYMKYKDIDFKQALEELSHDI